MKVYQNRIAATDFFNALSEHTAELVLLDWKIVLATGSDGATLDNSVTGIKVPTRF